MNYPHLSPLRWISHPQGKLMFRAIDENGDNMLTYKEMVRHCVPCGSHPLIPRRFVLSRWTFWSRRR